MLFEGSMTVSIEPWQPACHFHRHASPETDHLDRDFPPTWTGDAFGPAILAASDLSEVFQPHSPSNATHN